MERAHKAIKIQHFFAEIYDFPKMNIKLCLEKMLEAVPIMGMRAVDASYAKNPEMAYVILAESHMALHVVNEGNTRIAFLDIMTCGAGNPKK